MIHPNCSELVVKVGFENIDDLKSLIKWILEETASVLAIVEYIYTYSKVPLAEDYDKERVYYEIDPDDIEIKDVNGERYLGIDINKLPQSLSKKLPSWLTYGNMVSVYISKGKGSVLLDLDDDFVEFSISDGDEKSYKIFADISRVLIASPFPNDGGSISYFLEWCKKNGYEDIVKDCAYWGYVDDTS